MKIFYYDDMGGNAAAAVFLYFITGVYGMYKHVMARNYKLIPDQINRLQKDNSEKVIKYNILGIKPGEYDRIELCPMEYTSKNFESFKNITGDTAIILNISFTEKEKKSFECICATASHVLWVDHHKCSELFINETYGSFEKCPIKYGGVYAESGVSTAEILYVYLKGIYDYLDHKIAPTVKDFNFIANSMNMIISNPTAEKTKFIHEDSVEVLRLVSDADTGTISHYKNENTKFVKAALDSSKVSDSIIREHSMTKYLPQPLIVSNYLKREIIARSFSCLLSKNDDDTSIEREFWFDYLGDNKNLDDLINTGKIVHNANSNSSTIRLLDMSYGRIWDNKRCLIVNAKEKPEIFEDVIFNYEACIMWYFNGDYYIYSIFSKYVDCEEIAKMFGGGGHKTSAGFCRKTPVEEWL